MRSTRWLVSLLTAPALIACASSEHRPDAANVAIEGNAAVSSSTIREMAVRELRAFAARGRRAADLADAAYAMERGLNDLGHAHAAVSVAATPSEDQPDDVVFHVEEGPLAALGEVHFDGATTFPVERLRAYFRFAPTDLLGLDAAHFRIADVERAVAHVERLYLLDGFADVVVGPPALTWDEARAVADVHVPIVEGERTLVTSVDVVVEGPGSGDPGLRAELVRSLDLVGTPWHARVAAEAAATARQHMFQHGRRAAHAEGSAEVARGEARGARVVVTARPGPIYRLGEVVISGNVRTRTDFLRGLVALGEGDVLGQQAIDDAIDRLYGTGVLRTASVETPSVDAQHADVDASSGGRRSDLAVAVDELDARSVELGVGWGSYEQARGHVEYRDRNLFGAAREFAVRSSASLVSTGADVSLTDRYLLGPRNTVRLAAAWYQREEPSFDRRSLSGESSVSRDLGSGMLVRGGYRLRADEARNRDASIRGAEEDGFVRSAGVFVEGVRDTRDNALFPTAGALLEAGFFRSAPSLGADLDFLETNLSAAKYLPIADDTVLALGLAFTTRATADGRTTLPIQERLFLGGENSVRSFRESELGPSNATGAPLGGLTALQAHVELRRRIRGIVDGALFYDVGTVGRDAWDVGGRRGHAIGLGLRFRLPVGPIRIDFGWNPGDRFAADRPWALQFSFGFSF